MLTERFGQWYLLGRRGLTAAPVRVFEWGGLDGRSERPGRPICSFRGGHGSRGRARRKSGGAASHSRCGRNPASAAGDTGPFPGRKTRGRTGSQVTAHESAAAPSKALLGSAEAALKRAGLDFGRQQMLSPKGFASRATFEVSEAGRDQGIAMVKSAQAAFDAARDNVEVTKAQQAEARAQLAELQTVLAKAERDLDFTFVRAPVDGTFSNRLVNVGDMIQAGQRLGNLVPLNEVFIDANYKETQLKRIRPGQPVTIKVDAYGFRKFNGTVESISPAAGSVFTLLPPDNATGNFTKIVQRLPVRIRGPKDVAKQNLLRSGMSVYATVDTNEGAKDADSDADLDSPVMVHPQ